MMSSNNGGIKKMSLEEFLGDDSLGDSVWNEDDINLDAITNTTNIDLLRSRTHKQQGGGGGGGVGSSGELRRFEYRSPAYHNGLEGGINNNGRFNSIPTGPPYIVKFSRLPPNFASVDIDDLFREKFTKFNKCKMFWELNPNPSISTLNSGTIFEQNFKRESKVAFVELITSRDMDKILRFWTQPLLKFYNIKVELAKFDDFNEYNAKVKLLTEPKDDASKPYIPPMRPKQHLRSSKSSPFGSAKPVDTQSKILDIEEKVGKLRVEDTGTLRRISRSEPNNLQQQQHQPRVTLLKKSHENSASSSVDERQEQPVKPLSYLRVIRKTAEENKKSPSCNSSTTRLSSPATNPIAMASNSSLPGIAATTVNSISVAQSSSLHSSTSLEKGPSGPHSFEDSGNGLEKPGDQQQSHPYYHHHNSNNNHYSNNGLQHNHNNGEDNSYYKRPQFSDNTTSFRSRGGGARGGSFRKSSGPRSGGSGGGNSIKSQNDGRKGPSNYSHPSGSSPNHYNNNQQEGRNCSPEEKRYSIFKPASGFLWESGKDRSNSGYNQRGGGHFGRGSYRGARSRRNNGFTSV